jgi:hypothetical protein
MRTIDTLATTNVTFLTYCSLLFHQKQEQALLLDSIENANKPKDGVFMTSFPEAQVSKTSEINLLSTTLQPEITVASVSPYTFHQDIWPKVCSAICSRPQVQSSNLKRAFGLFSFFSLRSMVV